MWKSSIVRAIFFLENRDNKVPKNTDIPYGCVLNEELRERKSLQLCKLGHQMAGGQAHLVSSLFQNEFYCDTVSNRDENSSLYNNVQK